MAEEPSSGDAYDIVLADLKAKRAQLDHAIAAIEAIKSGNTNSIQPFGQSAVPIPATEVTPGMFHVERSGGPERFARIRSRSRFK